MLIRLLIQCRCDPAGDLEDYSDLEKAISIALKNLTKILVDVQLSNPH